MTDVRKFYGWKLVLALSVIVSVNLGLTFVGASVINAPMAKHLHLSRGTLGLGSTVFIIANGLVAPLAAHLVNAWGARLTLCFGSLLVALGALLLATWVSQGWHFVLAYGLILGLGNGFGALIPAQTCVTTWFERRRVLALSLVLTGTGLGGLIYAPLMTRVMAAADGNWRAAWYFVLGAGLAAAAISLLFVRNRPGDYGQVPDGGFAGAEEGGVPGQAAARSASTVYHTRERWTIREAVRTPALWLISAAAVGESATSTGGLAHAVPHLRDLGHSAEAAAAAIGAFSICSIAGKLSVGLLCDRIDPRNAWAACIMTMGLAVWVATRAQSTEAMFLFTGLLGFGSGGALACWHATVANYFGPAAFASILGAQMPFSNAMAAAGPYLVGLAFDVQGSYTPAFYALAAFSVLTALMLLAATPPRLAAIASS
jgi:cyanate permease